MVPIINPSPSLKDALQYNENKVKAGDAACIYSANYPKDTDKLGFTDKLKRLQNLAALNQRTILNAVHISLNFHPSEKLERETLIAIAESYMEKIGFGKQPYLVYEHWDAGHPHIHIVTTNIKDDAKSIDMFNIGKDKSAPARDQIEKDFGLIRAKGSGLGLWDMPALDIEKLQYGKTETKRAIANVVNHVIDKYKFTSVHEFNAVLKHYNVMADRGSKDSFSYRHDGLTYRVLNAEGEKVGVPIKASSISTKPILRRLYEKFKQNDKARQPFKGQIRNAVDWAILQNPGISLERLRDVLKNDKIEVILRTNDQGLVYGITYIDHENKAVFNGSDLGKQYSANAMRDRCQATEQIVHDLKSERPVFHSQKTVQNSPSLPKNYWEDLHEKVSSFKAAPSLGAVLKVFDFFHAGTGQDQFSQEFSRTRRKRKKRKY